MITLLQPGIYSLPEDQYHADPCPEPSLSGSVAIPLVHRSPLHAWHKHCRLNPNYKCEDSSRLDLGSACHAMLLGAGAEIEVIDFADYRTKAAQEARDVAIASGKIPMIAEKHKIAVAMSGVAKEFIGDLTVNGRPEQVMVWREGQAWCRGMVDWLADDRRLVLDYKTTAGSANPADVERTLFDQNYHMKAAFYERGLDVLDLDRSNIGRRKFLFMFQEIDAPFACSMVRLSEGAMTIGRKQSTYAIRRWQQCMKSSDWPGYGTLTHMMETPSWIEGRWINREINDPFATGETSPTLIMADVEPSTEQLTLGD